MTMPNSLKCLFSTSLLLISTAVMANDLVIASDSIKDGQIAKVHACGRHGGSDTSLHLQVKGIPADAPYLAIVSDDPDAVRPAGKVWVHWNVFNISVKGDTFVVNAGEKVQSDLGRTSGGSKGYEGMCPPDGVHTYRFAVYAMKEKVDVGGFFGPSAMTIDYFESKYKTQVLAKGMITGKF